MPVVDRIRYRVRVRCNRLITDLSYPGFGVAGALGNAAERDRNGVGHNCCDVTVGVTQVKVVDAFEYPDLVNGGGIVACR